MYTQAIWIFIGIMDAAIFLYGLSDAGREYWKKEAALVFATFLSIYLASAAVSGTIVTEPVSQSLTIVNNTTTMAFATPIAVQDDGLMWLCILCAFGQGIYTVNACIEAVEEYYAERDRKRQLT